MDSAIAVYATAAVASAAATATGQPGQPGQPGQDAGSGECKLLGPFSLLVQAALGALALLSLVYKRYKERPQRPLKVWAFDVSKQVFGSAMLHLANLLMSMFSAGEFDLSHEDRPNPCSFYLLNLGIDTTLGIPILIAVLRALNHLALYTPLADPPESIESGHYGQPPRASWWLKQAVVYFVGLSCMKVCVFVLIQLLPFIVRVGDWALRWTEGNSAVQIFFVMLFFPVIMNAIQYYVIDAFIKKAVAEDAAAGPSSSSLVTGRDDDDDDDDDGDRHRRSALLAALDDDDDDHSTDLDGSDDDFAKPSTSSAGGGGRRRRSSSSSSRSRHGAYRLHTARAPPR